MENWTLEIQELCLVLLLSQDVGQCSVIAVSDIVDIIAACCYLLRAKIHLLVINYGSLIN